MPTVTEVSGVGFIGSHKQATSRAFSECSVLAIPTVGRQDVWFVGLTITLSGTSLLHFPNVSKDDIQTSARRMAHMEQYFEDELRYMSQIAPTGTTVGYWKLLYIGAS